MKKLRQLHLYLGCLFAPLIIYFSVSGVWQVFRLNDVPKNETSEVRSFFHELSQPHVHSTLPGKNPKIDKSVLFNWGSAIMGVGMTVTSIFGIIIALRANQSSNRKRWVIACLLAGLIIPLCFLMLPIL